MSIILFIKRVHFLYIGLTFAHFGLSGRDPAFNASFVNTMSVQNKITLFFKKVRISAGGFLMSRSVMILFMVSLVVHG